MTMTQVESVEGHLEVTEPVVELETLEEGERVLSSGLSAGSYWKRARAALNKSQMSATGRAGLCDNNTFKVKTIKHYLFLLL